MYNVLNYKLNKDNVKKFIAASDPSIRHVIEKLILNTKHVAFEEFLSVINKNLKDIEKQLLPKRPLFIYIDTEHSQYINKSNYWLYQYVLQYLKNKEIKFVKNLDDEDIQDGDQVMILDDCAYSGQQLYNTIRHNIILNYGHKLQIFIFVCFMSHEAEENIRDAIKGNYHTMNCDIIFPTYIEYIYPITHYISTDNLKDLLDFYIEYESSDDWSNYTDNSEYIIEDAIPYPVYFDHKMADKLSSFPIIYAGVVPNKLNKKIITDITKLKRQDNYNIKDIKELESKLEMYPLLTHCENNKEINVNKPKCPVQPYNTGYNEFIKQIRKNTSIHSLKNKTKSKTYRRNTRSL